MRNKIKKLLDEFKIKELLLTKLEYCSDNAVMIGRVAIEQFLNQNYENSDILKEVIW